MRNRTWMKVAIVAVVAVFAMSCSLDYVLDFEITEVLLNLPYMGNVTVSYRITNMGGKDMENAMIHIRVDVSYVAGGSSMDTGWTPGATLATNEEVTGDLVFSFASPVASAEALIVSAGTDEGDSLY